MSRHIDKRTKGIAAVTQPLERFSVEGKTVKPELTVRQAGSIGGLATLIHRGIPYYQEIGRKGQKSFAARYSNEDRHRWGALGGRPRRRRLVGKECNRSERRNGESA